MRQALRLSKKVSPFLNSLSPSVLSRLGEFETTKALYNLIEAGYLEAVLPKKGEARICSFECTFCPDCATAMKETCPNCGGELLPRPKRMLES